MKLLLLLLLLLTTGTRIANAEQINVTASWTCLKNLNATLLGGVGGGDGMGPDPCGDFGTCRARNITSSICLCESGKKGTACDQLVVPLLWTYVVSALIVIGIAIVALTVVTLYNRRTKDADFISEHGRGWTFRFGAPSQGKRFFLLIYRFCIFIFCLGVHTASLAVDKGSIYKYYTVLNMILMITTFGFGVGVSTLSVFFPEKLSTNFGIILAKIQWILLEIELTAAVLVDIVTWAILFPPCLAPCGLLSFNSFVQHLANFFFLFGDYLMSSHRFIPPHVGYILIWPCVYGIFHLIWTSTQDTTIGHAPVYFFLNMADPLAPAWVIGVIILHSIIFFGWCGISKLLERVTSTQNNEEHKNLTDDAETGGGPSSSDVVVPSKI